MEGKADRFAKDYWSKNLKIPAHREELDETGNVSYRFEIKDRRSQWGCIPG